VIPICPLINQENEWARAQARGAEQNEFARIIQGSTIFLVLAMDDPTPCDFLAIGLATVILVGTVPSYAAEETPTKMVYRVEHPKYGDVGTYTNTIEKHAGDTTVTTQGRVKVLILGIVAYRQEFDRIERWIGSRLVNFHGVTTKNGKRTEVNGVAAGGQFTLTTASGTVSAPNNVKLANPWSEAVLKSEPVVSSQIVVTPEEGGLERVSVTGGESAAVTINGHQIEARHYRMEFQNEPKRYEVWFDGGGIPVRFADVSGTETVTFNLAECEGPAVCSWYGARSAERGSATHHG
jgi:hypothetical protein